MKPHIKLNFKSKESYLKQVVKADIRTLLFFLFILYNIQFQLFLPYS